MWKPAASSASALTGGWNSGWRWDQVGWIQVGDDILEMYGNEIKVAETQVGDEILETCGGNDIKFAETQVGDQFLGTDGTQATSLVAWYW